MIRLSSKVAQMVAELRACEEHDRTFLDYEKVADVLLAIEAHRCKVIQENENLLKAYINLTTENAKLDKALRFYAEYWDSPNDGPWGVNSRDFGNVAREALLNKKEQNDRS